LNTSNFEALGISGQFAQVLQQAEFTTPSKIQAQAIPVLLQGKDVLGIAQTGTGKTAAFGLPLLQLLDTMAQRPLAKQPRAVILAPTRELAMQIFAELSNFAQATDLQLACIYGGVGQGPQVKKLHKGVDILVATPGRLLDLTQQKHLNLNKVTHLVLDEADRLLDMGFIRDVKRIVAQTPKSRQSLLFSATMPKEVLDLAKDMLKSPVRIDVAPKEVTVAKIQQHVAFISNEDKLAALQHLLFQKEVTRAIVFGRTKYGCEKIARKLRGAGISAEAIHGNKSQNARNRALEAFKSGESWVLVATDIAARGIDIDGVSHVINYELPHEPESYVHRIGRTGRAGAAGSAWSLVDPSERKRLKAVERLIAFSPTVVKLDLPQQDLNAETGSQPDNKPVGNGQGQRQTEQRAGNQQRSEGNKRRRPRRRKIKRDAA
jgi:ATP-dependent RNA helicase RhlE